MSADSLPITTEKRENVAKSIITRGSRMLKRQNSKFNLLTADDSESWESFRKEHDVTELSQRTHSRSRSAQSDVSLKRKISEPFNFVHLTHTHRDHFSRLEAVSQNELVTEFSAIRASQAPRCELKGISAENLHFEGFSTMSQESITSPTVDFESSSRRPRSNSSSPKSPRTVPTHLETSPPTSPRALQRYRAVENFSHPNRNKLKSAPTIVPPPRTSSRIATISPQQQIFPDDESPVLPSFDHPPSIDSRIHGHRSNNVSVQSPPLSTGSQDDSPGYFHIAHAVTTPDDSAYLLHPSPFSGSGTELADVPEEDESASGQRSAARASLGRRPSAVRPTHTLRHASSFPSNSMANPRSDARFSLQNMSFLADSVPKRVSRRVLAPAFEDEEIPVVNTSKQKRMSIRLKSIDGSWEDVIDYSYEHAAEADCDFEWDRKSSDGSRNFSEHNIPDNLAVPNISVKYDDQDSVDPLAKFYSGPLTQSRIQRMRMAMPELEPGSALTISTNSLDLITPRQSYNSQPASKLHPSKSCDTLSYSPSLLIPQDYANAMSQDAIYEELLEGDHDDHQYQLLNPAIDMGNSRYDSPRSSRSALSKHNSQESAILSRAAAIVRHHRSTSSGGSLRDHHRSMSSGGSVPDLVRSSQNSEQFGVDYRHVGDRTSSNFDSPPVSPRSGAPLESRRRSIAKDLVTESMLRTASSFGSINEDVSEGHEEEPVSPSQPSSPTRAARPSSGKRMRSTSSVSLGKHRRSSTNRVSYSLFPVANAGPTSPKAI
ncbi:MAG: hypothetical protein M1834_000197 [Cirrosporium novae-zelandiae]|nr:MAG: hypothetical protein M1834_000197 [Cirrosporium novae-zelandiae]